VLVRGGVCATCPVSATRSSAYPWTPRASATATARIRYVAKKEIELRLRKGPAASGSSSRSGYGSPLLPPANKVLKAAAVLREHIVYGALEVCWTIPATTRDHPE